MVLFSSNKSAIKVDSVFVEPFNDCDWSVYSSLFIVFNPAPISIKCLSFNGSVYCNSTLISLPLLLLFCVLVVFSSIFKGSSYFLVFVFPLLLSLLVEEKSNSNSILRLLVLLNLLISSLLMFVS